jgi:hypothetical protein
MTALLSHYDQSQTPPDSSADSSAGSPGISTPESPSVSPAASLDAELPPTPVRCNVLGVGISAVNLESATKLINRWIDIREKKYVCVTGVHGVMESQSDQ